MISNQAEGNCETSNIRITLRNALTEESEYRSQLQITRITLPSLHLIGCQLGGALKDPLSVVSCCPIEYGNAGTNNGKDRYQDQKSEDDEQVAVSVFTGSGFFFLSK